jgi:uncharacterized delta-60 repeat protein
VRRVGLVLATLGALLCAAPAGAARPGDVDVSFGPGGVAYALPSPQPATSWGVTVTPGGSVVAAGVQWKPQLDPQGPPELAGALVRWTRDGIVDSAFGLLGSATAPEGVHLSTAPALRPDGGFVTGATSFGDRFTGFATVAFTATGQPNPAFGTGGVAWTSFDPARASAGEAIVQPDGKVVTVGSVGGGEIALVRHDRLGRPDRSFGDGGVVRTRLVANGRIANARAVARQPDGRLVVAAWYVDEESLIPDPRTMKVGWVVARHRADGTLDPSFGEGGIVRDASPSALNVTSSDVAIQPDGKILVAGSWGTPPREGDLAPGDTFAAVIRYRRDGSRDTGFGDGGIAGLADVRSGRAVAIQPDGRIVLGAYYEKPVRGRGRFDEAFALGRFRSDGRPDTSFGDGGYVLTRGALDPAGSLSLSGIVDVDLQGDRILATGPVSECGRGVFAVIAYHAAASSLPPAAGPLARVCTPRPEAEPDGELPIDVGCPALERVCDGDLTVELPGGDGARLPVARARFRARGGRADTVRPELPGTVRRRLEARRKLRATVLIRARNSRGKRASVRRRVVLRARS